MQSPFFDFYRVWLESLLRAQQMQLELWSACWQAAAQQGTRSPEDVARAAANQVSHAAGSVAEASEAANQERKSRKTA
jgi:hypothetical protein